MGMDLDASRELASYCGDITTCDCCDAELHWGRFTDGSYGYVDCWDSAVCRDRTTGEYFQHEPHYTASMFEAGA